MVKTFPPTHTLFLDSKVMMNSLEPFSQTLKDELSSFSCGQTNGRLWRI